MIWVGGDFKGFLSSVRVQPPAQDSTSPEFRAGCTGKQFHGTVKELAAPSDSVTNITEKAGSASFWGGRRNGHFCSSFYSMASLLVHSPKAAFCFPQQLCAPKPASVRKDCRGGKDNKESPECIQP